MERKSKTKKNSICVNKWSSLSYNVKISKNLETGHFLYFLVYRENMTQKEKAIE